MYTIIRKSFEHNIITIRITMYTEFRILMWVIGYYWTIYDGFLITDSY